MTTYIKCNLVDSETGKFTNNLMTPNGLTLPIVPGLDIKLKYEHDFFGTCNDDVESDPIAHYTVLTKDELIVELKKIFEKIRLERISDINALSLTRRNQVTSDYHFSEVFTAILKYKEAKDLLVYDTYCLSLGDTPSTVQAPSTPILSSEASIRNVSVSQVANEYKIKYDKLIDLDIKISSNTALLLDQANAIRFDDEILFDNIRAINFNINVGWPTS
jgi:hypothetical protein